MYNVTSLGKNMHKSTSPLIAKGVHLDAIAEAGKTVDEFLMTNGNFPNLAQLLNLSEASDLKGTCSGLNNEHYRSMGHMATGMETIQQVVMDNTIPWPQEIKERFAHMGCHFMMGLLPEIKGAWLTIDNNVYIWTYENETDLCYYEQLQEVIVSVGLVKPKPKVLPSCVKFLLVLTTETKIIAFGIHFKTPKRDGDPEAMQLLPEAIFDVPSDGVAISTIAGTECGRLFLGGMDGSLFEIEYWKEPNWQGKCFNKKNHSSSFLSYISFVLSALISRVDNAIVQISVDSSRNILYTLSEQGSVECWDLGESGDRISWVVTISQTHIVKSAQNIVKKLKPNHLGPIMHIKALEIADSRALHLVAVTKTGVRMYFSTCQPSQWSLRPRALNLRHVRMPPGFSYDSPAYQPPCSTKVLYSRGTLMLISAPDEDKSELWCLSNDLYPSASILTETQTILPLDGKVIAVCEEAEPSPLSCMRRDDAAEEEPPLIVRQHVETPTKYILLTTQGVRVVTKLRPIDLLRRLLVVNHGPDSEALKTFFSLLTEEQGCATSLLLACTEGIQDRQAAELATIAFFLYGGSATQLLTRAIDRAASPTSQPSAGLIAYSAKRNSLYTYVSRILAPIWMAKIVTAVDTPKKTILLESSISKKDCIWILKHLHFIKAFLDKNMQLPAKAGQCTRSVTSMYAVQVEKTSLLALKAFVGHACEVFALWKFLCEHQFHEFTDILDAVEKDYLCNFTFQDILQSGQALCTLLINGVINCNQGDPCSVEYIKGKLRKVCPNLYRFDDDQACTKANKLLLAAKKTVSGVKKEQKLKAALNLYMAVAPNIDLAGICQQFISNHFFIGVLQLCLKYVGEKDPDNIALQWYKNNEPPDDLDGCEAYEIRRCIYEQVTMALDHLYELSLLGTDIPCGPLASAYVAATHTVDSEAADAQRKMLLQQSLENDDELLHAAVLKWMMRKMLFDELTNIDSPSVEPFLRKEANHSPEAGELLRKHCHRKVLRRNHADAARLLFQMASSTYGPLKLPERVEYLERAVILVILMHCENVMSGPTLGDYLQELENHRDVAVIQQKVLDAILIMPNKDGHLDEAINRLNAELLNSNQLYEEFAEPLQLLECKLAIMHCTKQNDPERVSMIWRKIVGIAMTDEAAWALEGNEFHLVEAIAALATYFAENPQTVLPSAREAVTQTLDLILSCLPKNQHLIDCQEAVIQKFSRIH